MAHEIESMASVREVPWHGLGTVVEDKMTAVEALAAAGLDWRVNKVPYFTEGGAPDVYEIDDQHFAVKRTTDHKIIGAVGGDYHVLQNHEAFDFMDDLVDSGEAKYETAGSLRGGKWIFLTMKMPEHVLIAGEDAVDMHLVLLNSHDGSKAITGMVTPVRVVCMNTLNAALAGTKRKWSVRHLSTLQGKLMEARKQLELTFEYANAFRESMDILSQQKFTDSDYEQLVTKMKTTEKTASGLRDAWTNSTTHGRASRYDAYNAVGEYFDWLREPRSPNSAVMGTWFGKGVAGRDSALRLLQNS